MSLNVRQSFTGTDLYNNSNNNDNNTVNASHLNVYDQSKEDVI